MTFSHNSDLFRRPASDKSRHTLASHTLASQDLFSSKSSKISEASTQRELQTGDNTAANKIAPEKPKLRPPELKSFLLKVQSTTADHSSIKGQLQNGELRQIL